MNKKQFLIVWILSVFWVSPIFGATYYVRSSGGNDSNDGLSFAQGWATIQKGANTALGGDLVLICADGTHLPTTVVDFNAIAGSATSYPTFRGASASGADDGTVATISGTSLGAGADLININLTAIFIAFENLRFTAGKDENFNQANIVANLYFTNCRIDSAADIGFLHSSSGAGGIHTMYNCEIDSNGGDGIGQSAIARGGFRLIDCDVHDNGGKGVEEGQVNGIRILYSRIYDNVGDGVYFDSGTRANIEHTTIYGNGGDGIDLNTALTEIYIHNTSIASNGGYGIRTNGLAGKTYIDYNHFNANSLGEMDITTLGTHNQSGDPMFTSVVDGSENFLPLEGSPLIGNGLLGSTIGSYYAAIGGGGFFHPFSKVVLSQ